MIGETLAHYRILDELGAGGMGRVYLAEDTTLHRRIALKVLPPELAESPERLERFEREARTLAALDHPNIVTIHSVEEADGVRFLTMAYVEGDTLGELIPPQGLPLELFLELALPLAEGLRAAHDRGIVHRDLKPGNVMVDLTGRLRILDFGLAKLQPEPAPGATSHLATETQSPEMTREGSILGTYPYMSPEQAEGQPADVRSDLFSLGSVLYEMATGKRPFTGDSPASLVSSILKDTPRPLAEARPALPARLGEIVERCLEKDPADRYQTAAELRDELAELAQQATSGEARSAARLRRAKRWRAAGLAAGVLLLALLAGLWLWRAERAPPAAEKARIDSIAVLPLRNLSGDPEQEHFADGMTEALITDLSKIGALKVISRASAMRFKGTERPVAEIAAELGVDALVQGSVVREGDRVGITAQLTEAASGQNLWAERYERGLTSILQLQGEIARAVAQNIEVALTPEEQDLLTSAPEVNPAAHEAVVKGRMHLHRFTPQDVQIAKRYFETALEIDPDYAPAHVGLGRFWTFAAQSGIRSPAEARPRAKAAVLKALELDDTLAEAHMLLGGTKAWGEWDWKGAEEAYRRSLQLDPNHAEARIFYSHVLTMVGRAEEGTAQAEHALELDPLNVFFQGLYGVQMALAGRVDEAIHQLRSALDAAPPGFGFGREPLAHMLHVKGSYEEALAETRAAYAGRGDQEVVMALDRGYAEDGYREGMRQAAETLAARAEETFAAPAKIAQLYVKAGEGERALDWLERAYAKREPNLPPALVSPLFDELREDPRFQDLLRRMKLPR